MSESIRLDKWLWFARFVKTRALAQKLIARGQVTLNGAVVAKTSATVRERDAVAVTIGSVRRTVVVKAAGERRGPPTEARMLYEEAAPPERLGWEDAAPPLVRH